MTIIFDREEDELGYDDEGIVTTIDNLNPGDTLNLQSAKQTYRVAIQHPDGTSIEVSVNPNNTCIITAGDASLKIIILDSTGGRPLFEVIPGGKDDANPPG